MIVEMVGLPGSGKTTLAKAVREAGKREGVEILLPYGSELETQLIPRSPRYVKRHGHRRLLYSSILFANDNPELIAFCRQMRPEGAEADEFLFSLNGALYQNARDMGEGVCLFDESFLQRGVNLLMDQSRLETYLPLVPMPDLVVLLHVEAQVAFDRCIVRRGSGDGIREKVTSKFGDADQFEHRAALNQFSVDAVEERGAEVLQLDGTEAVDHLAQTVVEACLAKSNS